MANFRKRGKTWQFRLSYKDNNGEYKKFEKGGYKTKKEAAAPRQLRFLFLPFYRSSLKYASPRLAGG